MKVWVGIFILAVSLPVAAFGQARPYPGPDLQQIYQRLLAQAGFEEIGVEPTRLYEFAEGRIMGAFVRARKPLE